MMARIKVWEFRHLFYSGRLQLVNAVLLSVHSYWDVLPANVVQKFTSLFRAFIWEGKHL